MMLGSNITTDNAQELFKTSMMMKLSLIPSFFPLLIKLSVKTFTLVYILNQLTMLTFLPCQHYIIDHVVDMTSSYC